MKNSDEKFGSVAVAYAKKLIATKQCPSKAGWEDEASKVFEEGSACITKGCPRCCFLGLCEEGLINGIPEGEYTSSVKNKAYGLLAVDILREDESYKDEPSQLWKKVLKRGKYDESKQHNHQMDVVCALWNAGFIKTD